MTGRPSGYSDELADTICERICNGESLRRICLDDNMPSQSMVFRWLAQNETFREQYARAREAQADAIFDETLDIADDGSNDWLVRNHGDDPEESGWKVNGEHIQRSRLRVDTRKWMAGKLAPKKYGDKVLNEHSGPDGAPIQTQSTVLDAKLLTFEERQKMRELLETAAARKGKEGG